MIGATYSTDYYSEFQRNGDKNYFEEIIDMMILQEVSGFNESFRRAVQNLPKDKKRMAILSKLDKDRNLFLGIKGLLDSNVNKFNHIKDVILMLREYVKVGEVEKKKFGEVMTPLDLVKEMLSKLPSEVWSNPNLKWLDPANGTGPFPAMVIYKLMEGLKEWEPDEEKRYKHIVENMIYVCELQPKNMFLWLCAIDPWDKYKLNIYTGSFLDEGFDKHMKEVWGIDKFDVVVGNPPYNQMIDMDFVKKSYNISNIIYFVHPTTWLMDEKNKQKKFITTKELIKDHLENITLFNGNKLFGIGLFVPCAYILINKSKKTKGITCHDKINDVNLVYDDIYEINKYSNRDLYFSIKNKVLVYLSNHRNLWQHYLNNKDSKEYMVSFTGIRGNVEMNNDIKMVQADFYTIVSADRIVQKSTEKVGDSFLKFYFETEVEANNFLNYLKLTIIRFIFSIYKNNQNLHRGELSIIPMLDFTKKWTDIDIIKLFNFTKDEVDFMIEKIPNYYN
jgi:hypothetical protein